MPQPSTDTVPAPTDAGLAKVATGIAGLDDVTAGGLPAGRTTLVTGGPGSGKTVLALECIYRGVVAGEPAVFVSFEERAEAVRANAATLGWDLAVHEEAGRLAVVYAEPPVRAVRAGEFDIQGLLAVLGAQVEAIGARRIVIDAVDQLMRAFRDPERERDELHVLHDWLLKRGLTAILTLKSQPNGDLVYPSLGFLADCAIHLDQRILDQVRTRRLQVVKYRGSGFLSNEYPYIISGSGVVVMPVSTVTSGEVDGGTRASSGEAALDVILGGGYRTGSAVLMSGPTGAGKTTIASLFARAACERDEPVLFVSFEETPTTLLNGMASVGIDFTPYLEDGRLEVLSEMPEAMGAEEHLWGILTAMRALAARHVVVDGISSCRRFGPPTSAFDFVVRLLSAAKGSGVTVLFTDQTSTDGVTRGVSSLGIESLVDSILTLSYVQQEHGVRRRLLVLKSRGTSHSHRYHWLELGDGGISLSPDAAETVELPTGHLAPGDSGA